MNEIMFQFFNNCMFGLPSPAVSRSCRGTPLEARAICELDRRNIRRAHSAKRLLHSIAESATITGEFVYE